MSIHQDEDPRVAGESIFRFAHGQDAKAIVAALALVAVELRRIWELLDAQARADVARKP